MARIMAILFCVLFSCEGIKVPEKDGAGGDEKFDDLVKEDVHDIADDKDSKDVSKCPDGFIAINYPCKKEIICVDERKFKQFKTVWCYEKYDPDCCSGGQCEYKGTYECPKGTLCVKMGQSANDQCVKQEMVCGGSIGAQCPEGYFCELPPGACNIEDNEGNCVEIPKACPLDGETACQPVCGCDGFTYCNDCQRRQKLASKDYDGICCDHTKISFTQANKLKYDFYEVCVIKKVTDAEKQLQELDKTIYCGVAGGFAKCDQAYEIGCHGDLEFADETKMITDSKWSQICGISKLNFVTKIGGGHWL